MCVCVCVCICILYYLVGWETGEIVRGYQHLDALHALCKQMVETVSVGNSLMVVQLQNVIFDSHNFIY